jgi:hypothetical protein
LVIKALDPDWIRIGIQPKMLDPDPDDMNADPQPWFYGMSLGVYLYKLLLNLYFCRAFLPPGKLSYSSFIGRDAFENNF